MIINMSFLSLNDPKKNGTQNGDKSPTIDNQR